MGKGLSKAVLRKSLAVGADELILLDNSAFLDMDSYATAITLVEAIKKHGRFDLILTGIQAADTNAGMVGPGIAELLNIHCANNVNKINVNGNMVFIESLLPDGYQVVQASLPVVVTVNKSLGDLRMATTAALMEAQKREITIWSPEDLQIQPSAYQKTRLLRVDILHHDPNIEMIDGTTPDEKGFNLAQKLFSLGIIKKY
jgi:electron transfer flavoprotein beta subunit